MSPVRVQPGATPASPSPALPLPTVAKQWAEGQDFLGTAIRKHAFPKTSATSLPTAAQRAYALYSEWEHADLGSARIYKVPLNGVSVWALHTTTDGDEGFLELYDARGAALATGVTGLGDDGTGSGNWVPTITWDTKLFAVRSQVLPWGDEPSIRAFTESIDKATKVGSPLDQTIGVQELRVASEHLVGSELSSRSVDAFDSAFLHAMLADPTKKLTPVARDFGETLGGLYALPRTSGKIVYPKTRTVAHALGIKSDWTKRARWATATDRKGALPVHLDRLATFAERSFQAYPTQLTPATSGQAEEVLTRFGATTDEAKSAVSQLSFPGGKLFVGQLFKHDETWVPRSQGRVLFAVSNDGKTLRALLLAEQPKLDAVELAKLSVAELTGMVQDVDVVAETNVPEGRQLDLVYRPPLGGELRAKLTVLSARPAQGPSAVVKLDALAPILEHGLKEHLESTVAGAVGHPVDVVGWVGKDDAAGPGFVVAHKRPGTLGPVSLSSVVFSPNGSTVQPKVLGANEEELARDLALKIIQAYAEKLPEAAPEISDAARLEVALRTRWRDAASLEIPTPFEPGMGYDPANKLFELKMPAVWGDNAVFVNFGKDGKHWIDAS